MGRERRPVHDHGQDHDRPAPGQARRAAAHPDRARGRLPDRGGAMTGLAGRDAAPPSWLRLPRRTARLRLTMLYGGLFTVCGAGLLGFTFWLFYRATAGKRLVPLGTGYGQVVMRAGRSTLPPAACRHVHPNRLAQCMEGLGEARAHTFDPHVLLEQ